MSKFAHVRTRFSEALPRFSRDELGGATMWNLSWLLGLGIIAGLAIDVTNGRRIQTMMQSTADAASLAGVEDLLAPNYNIPFVAGSYDVTAKATATDFAHRNMAPEQHGEYIDNSRIYVGHWNYETRHFVWGARPVNAIRVELGRGQDNGNGLNTHLLHLAGVRQWTINAVAVAALKLTKCYNNGIIAAGVLNLTSNITVYSGCLHGEHGVDIQNNNYWHHGTGVTAGEGRSISVGPQQYDETGAATEVEQDHQHLTPSSLAYDSEGLGRAVLDLNDNFLHTYNPEYRFLRVAEMQNPAEPVIGLSTFRLGDTVPPENQAWLDDGTEFASLGSVSGVGALSGVSAVPNPAGLLLGDMLGEFDFSVATGENLAEYRTYYAPCGSKLTLDGTIRNVAIVSECRIEIAADSVLENVVLISLFDGSPYSMSAGQGVRFGADDGCAPGGGVRMHANGDFTAASGTQWRGTQVYVAGDFYLAGQTASSRGLSAHVVGDVHIAANAEIAALDDPVVVYNEIDDGGACVGEVDFEWVTSDYFPVLVE